MFDIKSSAVFDKYLRESERCLVAESVIDVDHASI